MLRIKLMREEERKTGEIERGRKREREREGELREQKQLDYQTFLQHDV